MNLTPLQINASSGLLRNEGLCANTANTDGSIVYFNSPLIKPLIDSIQIAKDTGVLSTATINTLSTLSPQCPALSNSGGNIAINVGAGPELYSTMGITSLKGKMISNIIRAGTNVTVVCSDGNICTGTVNSCGNITPSGEFINLIDASANSRYTDFDLSGCFKNTTPRTEANVYYPFLVSDFVEFPKDGNVANVAWIGKCWAQDKDYDKFVEKLHNLYLGAGGVLKDQSGLFGNSAVSYDYTVFVQAYNLIQGYMSQANQFINSANIGQDYLQNTFNGMSDLITGTVSSINPNIKGFSSDLNNLGKLINLDNLNDLGSPLALVRQIISITGYLPILSVAFLTVGIQQQVVGAIGSVDASVSDETQKLMYKALTLISGEALSQITKVLNVKTNGISTAADLLNPIKLFPNSYKTLKVPTKDGYQPIYVGATGVNPTLNQSLPAYTLRSTA